MTRLLRQATALLAFLSLLAPLPLAAQSPDSPDDADDSQSAESASEEAEGDESNDSEQETSDSEDETADTDDPDQSDESSEADEESDRTAETDGDASDEATAETEADDGDSTEPSDTSADEPSASNDTSDREDDSPDMSDDPDNSDDEDSRTSEKAGREAAEETERRAQDAASERAARDRAAEAASKRGDEAAGMVAVESADDPAVSIEQNDEGADLQIEIGGYLRAGFRHIQNDPAVDFVGRNDGFGLADARLSLHGTFPDKGFGFMFEFDGSIAEASGPNSPIAETEMAMTDAFAYYQPFDLLRVSVGQFKPPYDVEELVRNSELLFIRQSVGSRGVQNVEGFNVDGLSRTREVGLRVDGEPMYFWSDNDDPSGLGFDASLAVTNGQRANRNLNDNDKFAFYGRGVLLWGDYVELGGAYYFNDESRGVRPNRVGVRTTGWTADLTVDVAGLTVIGSVMSRTEDPFQNTDAQQGSTTGLAYQAQIGYEEPWLGLQPAYRFAFYDPAFRYNGSDIGETPIEHTRTHHTAGLNYNVPDYPVRVMANYTFALEGEPRSLENNQFEALVQMTW